MNCIKTAILKINDDPNVMLKHIENMSFNQHQQ